MPCRLYVDQPLAAGEEIVLPADQGHYLRNVMRLGPGDAVILFNGCGGEYTAHIKHLSKQGLSCNVLEHHQIERECECSMHVIQAACRSEKIDTVLQKGTELGAASFHIVRSERSSLRLEGSRLSRRLQRWQKIITEAAEQSGRTRLPGVGWHEDIAGISTAITTAGNGLKLCLHPSTNGGDLRSHLTDILDAPEIWLAIGPEGGWSPRDIESWHAAGFRMLQFGPRILRTETAAPALLAAIQALRSCLP